MGDEPSLPHSHTPTLPHSHTSSYRLYDFDRSDDPSPPGWLFQWPYFERRERLNGSLPMAYGLPTLAGHVGLYPDRWWTFEHDISANRLAAMAVRYVIGQPPRDINQFRDVSAGTPIPIYENLKAAPRFFLVSQAQRLPDPAAFFQAMESPDWDPRNTVLLEEPDAPLLEDSVNSQQSTVNSGDRGTVGPDKRAKGSTILQSFNPSILQSLNPSQDEPDWIAVEISTISPAYLVLADTYYPGWEALVDGQPTRIYRANLMARAVPVPEGSHRVEFRYRPLSFRIGAWLTGLALLAGILGCVLGRKASFGLTGWGDLLGESEARRAMKFLAVAAIFVLLLSALMEFGQWAQALPRTVGP